jgi:deoxyadenosine/deoxycytidine kinase
MPTLVRQLVQGALLATTLVSLQSACECLCTLGIWASAFGVVAAIAMLLTDDETFRLIDDEPFTIAMEGNISVGKTTAGRLVAEKWPTAYGLREECIYPKLLELMYSGKGYSFPFQLAQLVQRKATRQNVVNMKALGSYNTKPIMLLDRGIIGDYAFAIWNYIIGHITDAEMSAYESILNVTGLNDFVTSIGGTASQLDYLNAVVYFEGSPELCHARMINIRKVKSESGVQLSYLAGIDAVHFCLLVAVAATGRLPVYIYQTPTDMRKPPDPMQLHTLFTALANGTARRCRVMQSPVGADVIFEDSTATTPTQRYPQVKMYNGQIIRKAYAALAAGRSVYIKH